MPQRIGPYEILERLGEGAMGEVYLAEQHSPVRRRVALKLLKLGLATREVAARFELERQSLALLAHPNVARILDAGATADGRPYFAMEYVPGIAITRYCNERRLGPEARLELFRQVCAGVQHAHLRGIIHRDLKPSNILVCEIDGQSVPKIIDFGIAKATTAAGAAADGHTRFGHLLGTPDYMSPEQALLSPLDIDVRTDVYSLGVVLCELLTGALPHEAMRDGAGAAALAAEIAARDPLRPSARAAEPGEQSAARAAALGLTPRALAARLRGDLDWIVLRSLEKDRQRRYGSVAELAADLQRHAAHEAVLAGPPSVAYRASRFVRRHRLAVGALGTLFLASLVFGTGMAHLAREAARERDRATVEAATATQVSRFLINIFKVSNPAGDRGADVTARELLETASRALAGDLAGQPLVRARLHNAIGAVYLNLALWTRAAEQFATARGLLEGKVAPHDLDRLQALRGIARAAIGQHRHERAEPLLEEVLALSRSHHGEHHAAYADALHELATLFYQQGRHAAARETFERAYAARLAAYGPDAAELAETLNNVAVQLSITGDNVAAERVYAQVIEQLRRTKGEQHPQVLVAQINLASTLHELGRAEDALKLEQSIVPKARRVFGESHQYTLAATGNLANRLRAMGRYPEAHELHRHTARQLAASLGQAHPSTLYWSIQRAIDLALLGESGDALTLARETMQRATRSFGGQHVETLKVQVNATEVLRLLARHGESRQILLAALAQVRREFGSDHPLARQSLLGLADGAFAAGDEAEGRRWLAEARASGADFGNLAGQRTLEALRTAGRLDALLADADGR